MLQVSLCVIIGIQLTEPQYEKTLSDEEQSLKLVESIETNAYHYIEILSRAVDKVMPQPRTDPR